MAKSSLDDFIRDIETIIEYNWVEEVKQIFAQILRVMAVRTIVDTAQARTILVDIAIEKLGIDISNVVDEVYNGWGNNDRSPHNGDYASELAVNNDNIYFNFTAFDWGLANQEYNDIPSKNYPTQNPEYYEKTGRVGSYSPYHLTRTCDDFNDGKLSLAEDKLNELMNKLANVLEGRFS